jgi:hypothetical protein
MQKQWVVGRQKRWSARGEEPAGRACPLGKPRRGNLGPQTVGSKGSQPRRCPLGGVEARVR